MTTLRAIAFAALLTTTALASSPRVDSVLPRGAQRGQEVELKFYGRSLRDAVGLMFFESDIEVVEVEGLQNNLARAVIRIAPDCSLGLKHLVLRTRTGLSTVKTFFVGALPEHREKEPNDSMKTAQPIPLGVTVNGTIRREDVDWFAIEVEKPTRLVVEVQGVRLGQTAFDPAIAVFDATGRLMLRADDSAMARMDPIGVVKLERPGRYFIEVRESAYGGDNNCHYRFHMGDFPRPVGVIPAGGRPGETLEVTWIGDETRRDTITIPKTATLVHPYFPTDERGSAPTPVRLAVSDLPNFLETRTGTPEERRKSRHFEHPAAINGVLDAPGEVDIWTFDAKKGEDLEVRVRARALRSALDPVLWVRDAKNANLGANDDSNGRPDSNVRARIPADGRYRILVRDHLRRGGSDYFYRIEVRRRRADTWSRVVTPDEVPVIAVPRGGTMAALIGGRALPWRDELAPRLHDLPEGVTIESAPFTGYNSVAPVLLRAAEDAPLSGALTTVGATSKKGDRDLGFTHPLDLVRVRNNQPYLQAYLRKVPVAVTNPAPYSIELVPPKVPLVRGSPLRLEVRVKRNKDFKQPVRLRMLWNPPGIRSGGVTVPADKSVGHVSLSARGNATIGTWQIGILASAQHYGQLWVSSELEPLEVTAPWVSVSLGKCRVEQGRKTTLKVDLKPEREIAGSYRAEFLNLPRGVKTTYPAFEASTKSHTFELEIDQKSPPGRHRNLLFRVRIPTKTGTVIQYVRGGEVRIDRPLPPRKKKPAAKAKPAATTPAEKKKPATKKGTVANPKT